MSALPEEEPENFIFADKRKLDEGIPPGMVLSRIP
jgi:hypothetical protein